MDDEIINTCLVGDVRDCLKQIRDSGVRPQMAVTSPPYWRVRDYNATGQIGQEQTPQEYTTTLVDVFRGVRDVLADDGVLWVVIGDTYAKRKQGLIKRKDAIGIPWAFAFAMRDDGWFLRQEIIWHKPNPIPDNAKDRLTRSHETVFLFSKQERYQFDSVAIHEPCKRAGVFSGGNKNIDKSRNDRNRVVKPAKETRNKTDVWSVGVSSYGGKHFATYPARLITPCVLSGSQPGQIVLDPFMGSGTTALVCVQQRRKYIGCEINPQYVELQNERLAKVQIGPIL